MTSGYFTLTIALMIEKENTDFSVLFSMAEQ